MPGDLFYDCDHAVAFICAETGLPESTVWTVLNSRDRYHLGMEILPAGGLEEMGSPAVIRAADPDLFPKSAMAQHLLDPALELEFVDRHCGEDRTRIESVLLADVEYMRKVGIIGDVSAGELS